jgi:hypothetical protein
VATTGSTTAPRRRHDARVAEDRQPALREVRHTIDVATSYDGERALLGIGLVLRGPGKRFGPVLEAHAEAWADAPAGSGTAFAVLRALEMALERGWRVVRVRSPDNAERRRFEGLHAARAGAGGPMGPSEAAALELARSFENVQFRWVARRKNQQARALARKALGEGAPRWDHPRFAGLPARPLRRPPSRSAEPSDDFDWLTEDVEHEPSIGEGLDDEIPF